MGLKQIYPTFPQTDEGDDIITYVDIIAVHGLNPRSSTSHHVDTWEKEGHLWLKEALPKQTRNARIWTYSYSSSVFYGKDRSSFIQKADEFLEAIRIKRVTDPDRPLVLIGHSLGGLLIEQALVNAHNNPRYTHIKDATTGLAFFATPHNGGDPKLLTLGNITSNIARGVGFEKNKDILEALKDDSIYSGILREHWRQQILKYQIVSFWGSEDNIVSDKSAKFGTLPGNVEHVVKLTGSHSDICRFDPNNERDAENLEIVACNIQELYEIALKESVVAFSTHVLQTLAFERMTAKYQRVVTAHEDTFNWILEEHPSFSSPNGGEKNANFQKWFRENSMNKWMRRQTRDGEKNNVYWIVGKAGSGKSTLMKHIFKHPKTDRILSQWTGRSQLLRAGYFFERGHSSEQRMLQSLLYQLLSHDESMIQKVYKKLWERFASFKDIRRKRPDQKSSSDNDSETPPASEDPDVILPPPHSGEFKKSGVLESDVLGVDQLFEALTRATELISATTKLFFLIDGLDEIVGVEDGFHENRMTAYKVCQSLSQKIIKIAKHTNIKLCVSSRPHLGFEEELGKMKDYPRLDLERATGPDIEHYVNTQLGGNPRFTQMVGMDPQTAKEICQDIKIKASGMFLWVSIVVKLLIDGVENRSRLPDLKRKIRMIPRELSGENGLYMQMLKSVGSGQVAERSRLIRILYHSFSMEIALSPILLDLAEEEGKIEDLIHESRRANFNVAESLQRVKDRLISCCGGLFEVRSIDSPSQQGLGQDFYSNSIVDVVHGTVWEFLVEEATVKEVEQHKTTVPRFDKFEDHPPGPLTSLIRAAILSLHFLPPTTSKDRRERAKVPIDLVILATQTIDYDLLIMEPKDIHEKEVLQLMSNLIMVFDKVGDKAIQKTRRIFENSSRHWIYMVDQKLFNYFDDYESYMVSWLLQSGIILIVEVLLFDEKYKHIYNKDKSPICHAILRFLDGDASRNKLENSILLSIIARLSPQKIHSKLITSDFKEHDKNYRSLWSQILYVNHPRKETSVAQKLRYIELLRVLIKNVPNLLESPDGEASDVVCLLTLYFDDVEKERDELLRLIEPTRKNQESKCVLM